MKYAAVLEHYSMTDIDHEKYEAALYLIDNMDGHFSPEGKGIDSYIRTVRNYKLKTDIGKLSKLWRDCHEKSQTIMTPDSLVVSCEDLISNIDDAIQTWRSSPWHDTVPFSSFCEYILPYRVSDEHYNTAWRHELRENYKNEIEGITDVKVAFTEIRRKVLDRISNSNSFTPYTLDVLTYEHVRRANCDQRCLLLASVLRAFAIPAAIDAVPHWADYSTKGHAWVSLVLGDGTYTVYEDEDVPRQFNRIDASSFMKDSISCDGLHIPFDIKYKKKVAKIFRSGYADMHEDVSKSYGLNGIISVEAANNEKVWLCTFITGKDWQPITQAIGHDGVARFEYLGKDVVYLPVAEKEGKRIPLSVPILLDKNGVVHHLRGKRNANDTCAILLKRKYPLCSYMPVQWLKLIGSTIEGSGNPLFEMPDTLAVIDNAPYGRTIIDVDTTKRYRYIRFKSPDTDIALISELIFKDYNGNILNGKYLSALVDTNRISLLHDGDKETKIKALSPGYWVGIELGEQNSRQLSRIELVPVSDGNDIQTGHLYELLGFDTRWHVLGRQFAKTDECLVFDNIPRNMVLLLKDKTRGREERIFIYDERQQKQIWY